MVVPSGEGNALPLEELHQWKGCKDYLSDALVSNVGFCHVCLLEKTSAMIEKDKI